MTTRTGGRRPQRVLVLLVLALLTAACGSRLSHAEHVAANGGRSSSDRADNASDDSETTDLTLGPGEVPVGDSTATTIGGSTDDGATATTAAAIGGGATPAAGGAAIRVGRVGNFGGVAGASCAPARESLRAWVGLINAKGGINGHKVELLVADDGNEGTRDLSIAKDFVENRGVIALINYYGAAGGPDAVASYATSKGVPIIGGAAFDSTFYKYPIMFPQITGPQSFNYSAAKVMLDKGIKKVAIVYCTEGGVCKQNSDQFKAAAQKQGLQIVYEAGVSLAQPDFTAECVAARNAGATGFFPQVDGSSVNRLARSCSRQGFKPKYYVTAPIDPPDPLLEGAFTTIRTFPWFLTSGSPAIAEYAQAMQRYAPGTTGNSFTTSGWMSGKLLEVAAKRVSAKPTSREILEGLWAIQNETFGGISPAISFRKDQTAPDANCAFYIEVKGGKWTAPNGAGLVACR
jgi:branched-chain amino acid transport system substrate-binding protein